MASEISDSSKSLAQYLQARVWTKCFPKAPARSECLQFCILLVCLPVFLTTLDSDSFRPGRNDSYRGQKNSSPPQTSWPHQNWKATMPSIMSSHSARKGNQPHPVRRLRGPSGLKRPWDYLTPYVRDMNIAPSRPHSKVQEVLRQTYFPKHFLEECFPAREKS